MVDHISSSSTGKFSDLPARLVSGIAYILISVACIVAGEIPFLIYVTITAAVCSYEWSRMCTPIKAITICGTVLPALLIGIFFSLGYAGLGATLTCALVLSVGAYAITPESTIFSAISKTLVGALYVACALCCAISIYISIPATAGVGFISAGGILVLALFASIWISDGAAYLIGCRFGKHKLAPKISPKKSVEGCVAEIIACSIVWLLVSFIPGIDISPLAGIATGAVCAVAGIIGDLAESKLKRSVGVKDSGSIMPGHGGLLDRTDSLLLAAPAALAMLTLFGTVSPLA